MLESIGYKMLSGGETIGLYRVEVAAEEFLEMLGGSLILYAALLFCMTRAGKRGALKSVLLPSLSLFRPARR